MIEEYLNTETFTSRKELVAKTGMCDRAVRDKISNLKLEKPVIYNSQTKGYRLAKELSKLSREELIGEQLLIQHCINDIESRKEVFNQQERIYIAYMKELEKFLFRRTNEELYDRGYNRTVN